MIKSRGLFRDTPRSNFFRPISRLARARIFWGLFRAALARAFLLFDIYSETLALKYPEDCFERFVYALAEACYQILRPIFSDPCLEGLFRAFGFFEIYFHSNPIQFWLHLGSLKVHFEAIRFYSPRVYLLKFTKTSLKFPLRAYSLSRGKGVRFFPSYFKRISEDEVQNTGNTRHEELTFHTCKHTVKRKHRGISMTRWSQRCTLLTDFDPLSRQGRSASETLRRRNSPSRKRSDSHVSFRDFRGTQPGPHGVCIIFKWH